MKNFMILTESINFIENGLCEPITRGDIAKHCHVSLSMLEKLFSYALGMGIRDYIERRRMTRAAYDIVKTGAGVTQTAMKYQYNSAEVFTRAFKRVWNANPSEFKEGRKFTDIFPKINFNYGEGDDLYMARKRVDISEAYDYMRGKKGSYVLCFDVMHLTDFNRRSSKAGDLAIFETISRIERAADDDMLMLRIGGDEFALLTGYYSLAQAEKLMDGILEHNGETVLFEGECLPVSLWCAVTKVPEALRYGEFFSDMHGAIMESKVK